MLVNWISLWHSRPGLFPHIPYSQSHPTEDQLATIVIPQTSSSNSNLVGWTIVIFEGIIINDQAELQAFWETLAMLKY